MRGRTPTGDLLIHLDDKKPLLFRRSSKSSKKTTEPPFWDADPYTEHRLFERIVHALRNSRPEIGKEPMTETRRKVWALLAGFRFRGGYALEGLKTAIDQWLLARVGSAEDLETRRNAMLQDLAFRATRGDEPVKREDFFLYHKLDATPLTEWFALRVCSKRGCRT